ncbi:MAG: tRNA (adenosine(37)-N6)-dimethylallyltransferase MiaA [Candidatus Marinimicrobia bacterium]|nr:tRNA (adenosine(37)-N6)-dimethylallyltransferase MiaA [Candidatus Neomarinimicrobiota bacterium]
MIPIEIKNQLIDHPQADYLILAGATAVGKTETVLLLAERYEIEVISGDSRQIYKHMNIGTATPDAQLLQKVPHHLLDELNPDVVWSAAAFYQRARQLVSDILDKGKLPVVVGGAGLYLDALRFGLFDEQHKNPAVRQKYQTKMDEGLAEELWNQLLKLDPVYASSFHFNNHKKLMRAFEIYESSGMIPSKLFAESSDPFDKQDVFVVLDRNRPSLYDRINQRVLSMLEDGLVSECQQLIELGFSPTLYPMQTIGYKEVSLFLRGDIDEAEMINAIQQNTRNFAKRQLTWFRNHPFDHWIDLGK